MPIDTINTDYSNSHTRNIKAAVAKKGKHAINTVRPYLKPQYYVNKKDTYFNKLSMLKRYNIDTISSYKMAAMNDEDFYKLMDIITSDSDLEKRLLEGKSDFSMTVEKSEITDNISEKTYLANFYNGSGFYLDKSTTTQNGENKLSINRKQTAKKGVSSSSYLDTSSFNPDYKIFNKYSEKTTNSNGALKSVNNSRSINLSDKEGNLIFSYNYKRTCDKPSKTVTYDADGVKYIVKQTPDNNFIITNGNKKVVIDLLSMYEADSSLIDDIINAPHDEIPAIDNKSNQAKAKIKSQKRTILNAAKKLPPEILIAFYKNFDKITTNQDDKGDRIFNANLISSNVLAKSIIDACLEKEAKEKGLFEDEELIETFEKERQNLIDWLESPKENCLVMGEGYYLDKIASKEDDVEKSLCELLKSVSDILWLNDYDESKTCDEESRLILNFFPNTLSYLV